MTVWTSNGEYSCGWSFDDDTGCLPCKAKITDANRAIFQQAVDTAAEILYALSGRRFGACEHTVRPCRKDCCSPCNAGYAWQPTLVDGEWRNIRCHNGCGQDCSCTEMCIVDLPGPVASITSVVLDGVTLDTRDYRVDKGNQLVRLGKHTDVFAEFDDGGQLIGGTMHATGFANIGSSGALVIFAPDDSFDIDVPAGPNETIDLHVDNGEIITWPAAWTIVTSTGGTLAGNTFTGDFNGGFVRVRPTTVGTVTITYQPVTPEHPVNGFRAEARTTKVEAACWPTCQDMNKACGEDGTFCVTYKRGLPLPLGASNALAKLACELFYDCVDKSCCSLPKRVRSIQRDGVTYDMLDPMSFINEGLTGLYDIDLWLRSFNPKSRVRMAGVMSPDYEPPRETTWEA